MATCLEPGPALNSPDQSLQLPAAIVDSSPDAIIARTLDGRILSWNRGAETLFGYAANEVIGRHVGFVVPPERAPEYEVANARVLAGEAIFLWIRSASLATDGAST